MDPATILTIPYGEVRPVSSSLSSSSVSLSASNTAFQRILLPEYTDGVWKGKVKSVTGSRLPSARLVCHQNNFYTKWHSISLPFKVSINVVPDVDAPSELDTHNVMQWGQFVDHDITHTPLFRCSINLRCCVDIESLCLFLCRLSNDNSSGIQCCNDDGSGPIRLGLEESKNNKDTIWIDIHYWDL